jgi:hypothetical protein
MTEVQRVEGEIQVWRERRTDFEGKLAGARAEATRAQAERAQVLLQAKAEGDSKAQARLEAATTALVEAQREERDVVTVLAQIDAKLEGLAREHHAALTAATAAEYQATVERVLAATDALQAAVDAYERAHTSWFGAMRDAEQLRREMNRLQPSTERERPTADLIAREARSIPVDHLHWRLALAGTGLPFPHEYHRKELAALVRHVFFGPRPESQPAAEAAA